MKNLILASILVVGSFFAINVSAQKHDNHDRRPRAERQNRGRQIRPRIVFRNYNNRDRYTDTVVYNERKYVRINEDIYEETYRNTYLRNGYLVDSELISRQRIQNRNGLKFNIFLRF